MKFRTRTQANEEEFLQILGEIEQKTTKTQRHKGRIVNAVRSSVWFRFLGDFLGNFRLKRFFLSMNYMINIIIYSSSATHTHTHQSHPKIFCCYFFKNNVKITSALARKFRTNLPSGGRRNSKRNKTIICAPLIVCSPFGGCVCVWLSSARWVVHCRTATEGSKKPIPPTNRMRKRKNRPERSEGKGKVPFSAVGMNPERRT